MRVLEVDPPPTYTMGKNKKHKKHRKGKDASDTSEDGASASSSCTHIPKAVNVNAIRKICQKTSIGECTICSNDVSGKHTSKESTLAVPVEGAAAADVEESDITIWMCLQCGNQGCDRNSKEKHALKHYETPHSTVHCIALNISVWSAWCYVCDFEIPIENSKKIQDCVEVIRKHIGLPKIEIAPSGRRSRIESAIFNEQQTVVKDKSRPSTPKPTCTSMSCQKVKGLNNLGNTCFFNAVMQNLSQTHSLEGLLVDQCKKGLVVRLPGHPEPSDSESSNSSDDDIDEESHKSLPSIEINPADPGPLTLSLLSFLQEMTNTSTRGSTVNPSSLFGQVCKKAPRFKGYQQQDSHELLRYLLDAIKNEEIKRRQSGILKYFKIAESTNCKKVDEETRFKLRDYGRQAKHTFLDSLFGGQLISTIKCEECKQVSQIFEPFLDLSLPVTEEKPERPNKVLGGKKKDPVDSEEHVSKGVEGFAVRPDKPSKYAEKKMRKRASKDAKVKRKSNKAGQRHVASHSDKSVKDEGAKLSDETDEGRTKASKEKENEDQQSTDTDDPSDADIEDNLESDTARLQQGITDSEISFTENNASNSLLHSLPISSATLTSSASSVTSPTDDFHNVTKDSGQTDKGSGQTEEDSGQTEKRNGQIEEATGQMDKGSGQIEKDSIKQDIVSNPNGSIETNGHVDDLTSAINDLQITKKEESKVPDNCDKANITDPSLRQSEKLTNGLHQTPFEVSVSVENVSLELQHSNGSVALENSSVNIGSESSCQRCVNSAFSAVQKNENSSCDYKNTSKQDNDHTAADSVTCQDEVSQTNSRRYSKQQKSKKELKQLCQTKSLNTLSPRYHPSSKECSIMSCLHQFTLPELLTGSNKFGCKMCTKQQKNKHKDKKTEMVYSNASKQFLVFEPPAVLTLHLKRFEQIGYNSRKVNRHVEFPFLLDLGPYCSSLCQGVRQGQKMVAYSLYGLVEHSGHLSGGHYTAYVKIRPSLGTVTNFLNTQLSTPMDYIHHYTEQYTNDAKVPDEDVSDDFLENIPPGKWYHISDSNVREVQETTVQRAQAYLLFYERIY